MTEVISLTSSPWFNSRPQNFGTISIPGMESDSSSSSSSSSSNKSEKTLKFSIKSEKNIDKNDKYYENSELLRTNEIKSVDVEILGQTLQNELDFLATTHFIHSNNNEKSLKESIKNQKYKYFSDSSSDFNEKDNINEKFEEEPILKERNIPFKFQNFNYIPPISKESYDHLNKSKKVLKESENKEEIIERPKIKIKKLTLNKDLHPPKEIKEKLLKKQEIENNINSLNKKTIKNIISREFPTINLSKKKIQEKEIKNIKKFKKYKKKEIKNLTPSSIKLKNPELYDENFNNIPKDNLENKIESNIEIPNSTKILTSKEKINLLEGKLSNKEISEWKNIEKENNNIEEENLDSFSNDFVFDENEILNIKKILKNNLKIKKIFINSNETEAVRMRNQAIKQKLILIKTKNNINKELELERIENNKEISKKVSKSIKKLENEIEIQKRDLDDEIQRKIEDEKDRINSLKHRIKVVKKTEFIGKRESRKIKKLSEENSKIKEIKNQKNDSEIRAELRSKKNLELMNLWKNNYLDLIE